MSESRVPQESPNQDEINALLNLKAKLAHQAEETDRLLHQLQDLKLNSQQKNISSSVGRPTTDSVRQSTVIGRQPSALSTTSLDARQNQGPTTDSARLSPVLGRQSSTSSTTSLNTKQNQRIILPKPTTNTRHSTSEKIQQLKKQLKHLPFVQNTQKKWVVSEEEQSRYNVIFSDIDEDKDGIVTLPEVKPIFLQSQLPSTSLKKIWTLCDIDQSGRLMREEFALSMWLIERAVRNIPVPDQLTEDMLPPINIRTILANKTQVESNTWVVNVVDEQRYNVMFFEVDKDVTGFVNGEDAKQLFLQSGLPSNVLFHIWSLCDATQCGKLSREQFALAMWLIEQKIKGIELPSQLTPEMIPPSMRTKKPGTSQGVEPSAPSYDSLPPRHVLGRPPKDEQKPSTHHSQFGDNFVATPSNQDKTSINGDYIKGVDATLLGVVEVKRNLDGISPMMRAILAEFCRNSLQESGNTNIPNIEETSSNESWIGRLRSTNLPVTVKTNLDNKKLELHVGNEMVNQHSILNISTLVILKDDCRQLVYIVNFGNPHYCRQMAVVLAFNDQNHALELSNLFRDIKKQANGDTSIVKINLPKTNMASLNSNNLNGVNSVSSTLVGERNQGTCNDLRTEHIQDSIIYENDLEYKTSEITVTETYENEIQVERTYENENQITRTYENNNTNLESEESSVYEDEICEYDSQDGNTYQNEGNNHALSMHSESERIYENALQNSLPCVNPPTQDKSNNIPDLSDSIYEYEDSQPPQQQQQTPSQREHVRKTHIPVKNNNIPPSLPPRNPMKNTIEKKIGTGKSQKKVHNDKQKMNLKDVRKLLSGFKKSSKYEYQNHNTKTSQDSELLSYQSWSMSQSQACVNNVVVPKPVQLQTPPLFTQKNHDFPQVNDDDFSDFSSDDGLNN